MARSRRNGRRSGDRSGRLRGIGRTLSLREQRIGGMARLDGVRGWTALCVLGAHAQAFSVGFGATGVWLFFLLSGYLRGGSLQRAFARGSVTVEIMRYLVRRVFRILPIYYLAVAV